MMSELRAPRRPVVGHVVPPEVELMTNSLARQQIGERARAVQCAGRVLPLTLAADQHHAHARAQPVEMVAAEVLEVVHRVVEVGGVAALAPRAPVRGVVAARHAQRDREEVGPAQREVRRVVRAEARARGNDVAARVVVDERRDDVRDPALVLAVAPRALLERYVVRAPGPRVRAVGAVDLDASVVDQRRKRADHPAVLPVPALAELGGEDEQRPAPVAVDDQPRRADLEIAAR